MTFVTKNTVFLVLAAAILAAPTLARAQDQPKVRIGFGGGISGGAIDSGATANLLLGYRFSKMFSFDVNLAAIDGSDDDFSIRILDRDFSAGVGGGTFVSTVGFRFHIPTTDARFQPYVSGGLGIAATEQDYDIRVFASNDPRSRTTLPTDFSIDDDTHTGMAASAIVGADIRVWKGLSFGVDARYYRLDRGRNVGTFGGSISYGF